jgi:hypothetical protein
MPRYFYEITPPDYSGVPNLFHHVSDQILGEFPPLCELQRPWGIPNMDHRLNDTLKIEFNLSHEDEVLWDALKKAPPVPAGEGFSICKYMAAGVIYKGVVYTVDCGDTDITFDICVYNAKTGDEVQRLSDISASEAAFANGELLADPHLIQGGEPLVACITFNQLPYVNTNGEGVWGDKDNCLQSPCIHIRAHFLVEDTCHAPRIKGCGYGADCCSYIPCEPECCTAPPPPKPCVKDTAECCDPILD